MQCTACGMVNNPGRVYCGGCARAIGEVCPVCLFVNEAIDRYCGGCARDLLVAPIEPVPAVRAAVVGPAAKTATVPVKPPVSLEDLADLTGGVVPGGSAAAPPAGAADTTQSEVDGFFQRLAREGEVEIAPLPAAPGAVSAPPRSARS